MEKEKENQINDEAVEENPETPTETEEKQEPPVEKTDTERHQEILDTLRELTKSMADMAQELKHFKNEFEKWRRAGKF